MTSPRTVAAADDGVRLDRWFARHYPQVGRNSLFRLLRTGQIRVDGKRAAADTRLAAGQSLRVPPQARAAAAPSVPEAAALELRARVLFLDDDIVAIDKPPGLAVQGGTGQRGHVDGLSDALRFDADARPRLVHRLDKETSGVLVLARHAAAARRIAGLFRRGAVAKTYWAIVAGAPRPASGSVESALGKTGAQRIAETPDGRPATTRYATLDRAGRRAAWLELQPLTGRTHQLRVHCAGLGAPILGDRKYGGARDGARRLHLHARRLELPDRPSIEAPLPPHFRETLERYGFAAPAGP